LKPERVLRPVRSQEDKIEKGAVGNCALFFIIEEAVRRATLSREAFFCRSRLIALQSKNSPNP